MEAFGKVNEEGEMPEARRPVEAIVTYYPSREDEQKKPNTGNDIKSGEEGIDGKYALKVKTSELN